MTKSEEQKVLIENMDVIRSLANKYRSYGVDVDDLAQEGSIGFLKGLRNWSPEGGASIRTYAGQWAHVYIRRAVGCKPDGTLDPEERTTSMDQQLELKGHSGVGRTMHDVVPSDTFESPEDIAIRNERIQEVLNAMESKKISYREITIIRNNILGDDTLDSVSKELGCVRQRVGQIKDGLIESVARIARRAS